jgi:membrane protein DedA with SNARE-associated domain
VAVVSGSSLLYLVGRRWGRRIVHGRVGVALHMTPERLEKTEGFFHKWGFWTILVGRHVPGGRVPLSVAAGIFDVRYPVFLVSVAISSAIWIGIFMVAGVKLGPKVEEMMHAHRTTSVLAPIVVVLALTGYLVFRLITVRGHSEKKR